MVERAKPSTLHKHSQGNIEEVFVCRYVHNPRACHHPQNKNKTKPRERRHK